MFYFSTYVLITAPFSHRGVYLILSYHNILSYLREFTIGAYNRFNPTRTIPTPTPHTRVFSLKVPVIKCLKLFNYYVSHGRCLYKCS